MKTSPSIIHRIGLTLALTIGAWTTGLHAQPGSLDASFNAVATSPPMPPAPFWSHIGFSVAVQPDGKVIAAGTFGVMRLLGDGSIDATFQTIPPGPAPFTGPGSGIGAVALQPDGRILVTGSFTNSAGVPLPGILRLQSDGTIDPSFNLSSGIYPEGRVIALQPDGKVVSSGFYFGPGPGDDERSGLLRLHPDGSLDPDFDIRESNFSRELYSLALTPEGKIYSGDFNQLTRTNPDGSRDDSFNPGLGLGPFGAIAVQPDGKVIVGQYSDGAGFKSIRRLLPNGADDPDWIVPDVDGGDAVVYALLLQPDGKVLVGGNNLQGFNGVGNANLGRLHPDGSVDTTFDTRPDLHHYSVEDMALAPDGKVVVAGYHLEWPDLTPAPSIWRLNNDAGPSGIEFTAPNYVAREGDGWLNISVRRTTETNKLAVVTYAVRPGTATRWRDYFGGNGVLVFRPGETLKRIRIYVVRDRKPENFETVRLALVRARGGSIGPQRTATLTILDK